MYSSAARCYNTTIAGRKTHCKTGNEVAEMNARERIMTLRLMDMLRANPAYAERLGIAITIKAARSGAT